MSGPLVIRCNTSTTSPSEVVWVGYPSNKGSFDSNYSLFQDSSLKTELYPQIIAGQNFQCKFGVPGVNSMGPSSNYDNSRINGNQIVNNTEPNQQTIWGFYSYNGSSLVPIDLTNTNFSNPIQCWIKDMTFSDGTKQRWWKHNGTTLTNDQLDNGNPFTNGSSTSPRDYNFYIQYVSSIPTNELIVCPNILASSDIGQINNKQRVNWNSFPTVALITRKQCGPEHLQNYIGKRTYGTNKYLLVENDISLIIDDEMTVPEENFEILKNFKNKGYIARFNNIYIFASSSSTISERSFQKLNKYVQAKLGLPKLYPLKDSLTCRN